MPVTAMTASKRKSFSQKEQQMIELSCHALKEIGNHLVQGTFQNTNQADIQSTPASTPKLKKNHTPINSHSNGVPQTLFSLVSPSASALNKGLNVPEISTPWHQAIVPLAELLQEIGEQVKLLQAEQGEEEEEYDIQAKRLLTRYVSVKNTLAVYADRLNNEASEANLTEKLEKQLEQDEEQWELQMAERQQSLVFLQQELERLQNQTDEEEEEVDTNEEEIEEEDKELVEDLKSENESLKELLALRMEEKNDLTSVYNMFTKTKKRQLEEEEQTQNEQKNLKRQKLVEEKNQLETKKKLLQEETLQAEQILLQEEKKDQEMLEIKAKIDSKTYQIQEIHLQIEKQKQKNLAYKTQMKQMIQLVKTQKEEAMILFLLDENHGEMNMNELKQLVAQQIEGTNNATVIRAMYSLVANGLAHIDRTGGNGIVSSLIV